MAGLVALAVFIAVAATLALLTRSGIADRLAIDEPNERSLHKVATPRIGGLVVIPLAIAGWLACTSMLWPLAALAGVLSMLSFFDDRADLPIALRFGVHLAAAGVAVWLLMPDAPLVIACATAVAIAWLINLYNFMDGADGMAGGMAIAGFGAYAAAAHLAGQPGLALPALMIAVAAAGFMMLNFPPATVFLGDAGSIPLGFLAGALGLAGIVQGVWGWWFPLLAFSPFIVDATATLLRRGLRGEKVWRAHREHAYQKLVRAGWSHRRLLAVEWPLMVVTAVAAVALREAEQVAGALFGLSALFVALLTLVERRWRRQDEKGR